jgi:anti-sigma factor RsiW
MTACPDKLLLLQAHVDGELDAASTLALEAHLRSCTGCTDELARIEAVRTMLEESDLDHTAPAALRSRIEAMIAPPPFARAAPRTSPDRTSTSSRVRFGFAGGGPVGIGKSWGSGVATGLALSLALAFVLPQFTRVNTEDQLVANHIRSLSLENHLTDVATSNRHVVKPWFNGKIDFAPPVPELAAQGFPLVGGRLDYVDGHEVAAIVYKRRLHTINVFVQPARTLSLPVGISTKHDGYSLIRWTNAGLEFWAISDIDMGELQLFHRSFVNQPSL